MDRGVLKAMEERHRQRGQGVCPRVNISSLSLKDISRDRFQQLGRWQVFRLEEGEAMRLSVRNAAVFIAASVGEGGGLALSVDPMCT